MDQGPDSQAKAAVLVGQQGTGLRQNVGASVRAQRAGGQDRSNTHSGSVGLNVSWAPDLWGQIGDAVRAQSLYEEAVALPDPPAAAFREHGMSLRAQGDPEGATAAFHRYLALAPDAADAAFVRQYLSELETRP